MFLKEIQAIFLSKVVIKVESCIQILKMIKKLYLEYFGINSLILKKIDAYMIGSKKSNKKMLKYHSQALKNGEQTYILSQVE